MVCLCLYMLCCVCFCLLPVSVRPRSLSGSPTLLSSSGSLGHGSVLPSSQTVHSFVSLHHHYCCSSDHTLQEDREEAAEEKVHQFCCSASGCSSPSSR
uniref:Secreted protein n=1 Tax=Knipowitschia caucasica TaxID=637954 RepID=A0AAV2M033_KNICA